MITLDDCIGLCGAEAEAVEQLACREGLPAILAAARLQALAQAANEPIGALLVRDVPSARLAA